MENQGQSVASDPASDSRDEADLLRQWQQRRQEQGLPPVAEPRESKFERVIREMKERIAAEPGPTPEQIAADKRRAAEAKEAATRERMKELVGQAGLRYAKCGFDTFATSTDYQRRVVATVREYMERTNRGEGLVLYGPCGTGKDHLAFAVAASEVCSGADVAWLNGQDWFGKVRDAMDSDTTEAALVNQIARPALAVISDPLPPIGNLSPHQATMLYRVVQARYQAGKPTIVTVNVSSDQEADERLGVPTWDRLCDGAWKIHCNWPSFRKPAREIR